MKTNKHITSEINSVFIAAGCYPMLAETSELDYYHSETEVYLRYSPELLDGPYHALANLTEVVVVTSDDATAPASASDLPCEVIKLKDLSEFLHFRSASKECVSHRVARQTYTCALDDFEEAHSKMARSAKAFRVAKSKVSTAGELLNKAREVHLSATASYFAHKPPRFRPVDCC